VQVLSDCFSHRVRNFVETVADDFTLNHVGSVVVPVVFSHYLFPVVLGI
jgi:hypothetical protein